MRLPASIRPAFSLLLLSSFCSGAAALVYQINWQRELTVVFGVSHFATTTVVGAFFLGFALGARFIRSFLDRIKRPCLVVAALEAVIGLFALISPQIFSYIHVISSALLPTTDTSTLKYILVRATLVTLALLIPTAAMGAALPTLFKAGGVRREARGSGIGMLAGTNTLGALAGALLTTFLLMGSLDGTAQTQLAVSMNFLAVGLALLAARWSANEPAPQAQTVATVTGNTDVVLLAAYTLSGAAALGLELIWNRLVYLCFQHTIYTFALTLTVYLGAFALGNLVSSLWLRHHRPRRNAIAALLVLTVATTLAGFFLYKQGLHFYWFADLGYFTSGTLIAAIFIFAPSFLMGVNTPFIYELLTGGMERLGADTSRVQMWNNSGSLCAILLVGFFLIPRFSLDIVAFTCVLLLSLGACLVLVFPLGRAALGWRVSGAVAILALTWFAFPWKLHDGHVQMFYRHPIAMVEDESGLWALDRVKPHHVILKLNGYYEMDMEVPPKGILEDDFLIPAMLHPNVRRAYMVGLGLGVGAYEMLKMPELQTFDAAEISKGAVKLARIAWKRSPLSIFKDARFHVVPEDGRLYLARTATNYDVIFSGTVRTFYPGSTHLYSAEYWKMARERLAPDGLFVQWLPLYSEASSRSLLKTFVSVFPDALVLRYQNCLYLLGFRDGRPSDLARRVQRAYARAASLFATTYYPNPQAILKNLYRPSGISEDAAVPINRDDFPFVEYSFRGFESMDEDFNMVKSYLLPWEGQDPRVSTQRAVPSHLPNSGV